GYIHALPPARHLARCRCRCRDDLHRHPPAPLARRRLTCGIAEETDMSIRYATLALCLLLPLAAQAGDPSPAGINAEIRQEMREAREEVRAELAEARRELATENRRIDNSLRFARRDGGPSGELPRARNTP